MHRSAHAEAGSGRFLPIDDETIDVGLGRDEDASCCRKVCCNCICLDLVYDRVYSNVVAVLVMSFAASLLNPLMFQVHIYV